MHTVCMHHEAQLLPMLNNILGRSTCRIATAEQHVSVPKSFADTDVSKQFQRFEVCSKASNWNTATQVLELPMVLE